MKKFLKRFGQIIQSPGALLAVIIYGILAIFKVTTGDADNRIKSVLMVSIPWTSGGVWLLAFICLFRHLWN